MAGDVHHRVLAVQLVLHCLLGEITVEQDGSWQDTVRPLHVCVFDDLVQLARYRRQRRQTLLILARNAHRHRAQVADIRFV